MQPHSSPLGAVSDSKERGGGAKGTQLCQHLDFRMADAWSYKITNQLFGASKFVINCNNGRWKLIPKGKRVSSVKG